MTDPTVTDFVDRLTDMVMGLEHLVELIDGELPQAYLIEAANLISKAREAIIVNA